MTDGDPPEPTRMATAGDYTDAIRAELRGLTRQLEELAHRLARIEDHLRMNGRL